MLLSAPAPVTAALLAADHALVEQGHRQALLGERIGGGAAGDAGADHDDIDGGGELEVADDGLNGRGHRFFLTNATEGHTIAYALRAGTRRGTF